MFSYDSPLMRVLNKISDFMILSLLTFICCIPIITIGASITAAHYTALKMRRDTDNYVFRNFFKSFKTNFVQSTIIWLIGFLFTGLNVAAFFLYGNGTLQSVFKGIVLAVLFLTAIVNIWVWPLQSKFINPVGRTIKNAMLLGCKHFFRTLLMLVIVLAAGALWYICGLRFFWVILFFGFSIPIYLCAMVYDKVFQQLEDRIRESQQSEEDVIDEDDVIMHDESKYIEQDEKQ